MQKSDYLLSMLASVVLALVVWAVIAYPRSVAEEWHGPLKSASFAPFHDGQSPLKAIYPSAPQIEADLVQLKGVFQGVRTYTSTNGMEVVPALAAKHGFQLTHSAWLGRDQALNATEIDALIASANHYPQAVQRVIVGNEVLLRQELTPAELIAHIDRVRAAIKQPVSYADVWAFWLANPQLVEHVDYITIHILPYWEDEPVAVEAAHQHLINTIELIKKRFPGKPVLVGETGWPTQGRSRGPAAASLVNAAEYVRRLPALAEQHNFDYNVVEAFDQSWKARQEGTVGARWGLFDHERKLKYPLSGKVTPMADALPRIAISILLGLLIAALLVTKLATRTQATVIAAASQLFAASLVYSLYTAIQLTISPASFTWLQQQWLFYGSDHGWFEPASFDNLYRALLIDGAEKQALLWGWIMALFAVLFASSMMLWLRALIAKAPMGRSATLARSAYGLYTLGALVYAYMFANVGRYMDIPLPHYLLPLTAALMLLLLRNMHRTDSPDYTLFTRCGLYNRLARVLLSLAGLYCLWGEISAMRGGQDFVAMHPTLEQQIPLLASSILANHELLAWCVVCVVLSLPMAASRGRGKRG